MAKFQLTLSPNYVPTWGTYEGIREIIQNAIDGQADGYPMAICHTGKHLEVTSAGARLDRKVWLMGTTSKQDDEQYLGHFGEGLKLAALVLTRLGRKLSIINGDESWTPSLESSKVFDETVLTISTRKCIDAGLFRVTVPMDLHEWESYKDRFLQLSPPSSAIPTCMADILLDEPHRKNLYVKGIYVEERPNFYAGYSFHSAKTDRDRAIVSSWDLRCAVRNAWRDAWKGGLISAADALAFLESGAEDAAHFDYGLNDGFTGAIKAAFLTKHGDDSIPVTDDAQRQLVSHYGKRGVTVPGYLKKFFEGCPGMDVEALSSEMKTQVLEVFSTEQLTPAERAVFHQGLALAELAAAAERLAPVADRLEIVRFASSELLGLHTSAGPIRISRTGQIQISRPVLASFQGFLSALIHELGHDFGDDGSVAHERAEGRLFASIVDHLLKSGSAIELSREVLVSLAA